MSGMCGTHENPIDLSWQRLMGLESDLGPNVYSPTSKHTSIKPMSSESLNYFHTGGFVSYMVYRMYTVTCAFQT